MELRVFVPGKALTEGLQGSTLPEALMGVQSIADAQPAEPNSFDVIISTTSDIDSITRAIRSSISPRLVVREAMPYERNMVKRVPILDN